MMIMRLRLLAMATVLSLVGLLSLQGRWLWFSYRDARASFERRVDVLLSKTVERIDPGDALFQQIAAILEPQGKEPDSVAVHDALRTLRAQFDVDLQEVVDGQSFTVLLSRKTPAGYWSDPAGNDTAGMRTARLHRVCERCDGRIGIVLRSVGPTHFLAEMSGILIVSIILVSAQIAGVAAILTSLVDLRRRQAEQIAFINTVAHEFQTPLFTISLASSVLAQSPAVSGDGGLARQVAVIGKAKERLALRTRRLLRLTTTNLGPAAVSVIGFDGIVSAAVEQIEPVADALGAEVSLELRAPDAMVRGDPSDLDEMVLNLVDNAIKYGGTPARVTVLTQVEGSAAVLRVEDSGQGIARQIRQRIFDPFFRHTEGSAADVPGFGLGLSQVRSAVERHAGTVAIEESRLGGAALVIKLPLASDGPES